jgi:hypothetical protein
MDLVNRKSITLKQITVYDHVSILRHELAFMEKNIVSFLFYFSWVVYGAMGVV